MVALADPHAYGFQQDVMALTDNNGVDIVLQLTTESLPNTCDDILAYGVRICKVGATRTTVSGIPNARYSALHLSSYMKRSQKRVQNVSRIVADHLDSGVLRPTDEEASHIANAASDIDELARVKFTKTVVLDIPDDYRPSQIQAATFKLRPDATYIVTGAETALGLECCRWLTDQGAAHVARVSSEVNASVFTKATRMYMESNNTKVYDIQKSITSPEDVRDIIKELEQQHAAPIRGIFNLAGNQADLTSSDPEDIRYSLNTQFRAAQLLGEEATLSLDYFVVLTSVDATLGTETVRSRSAVGAALGGLCERRRASGRCGLCLQLGQIRGVGDSGSENPELTEMAEAAGTKSLHFHEYLRILGSLLDKDHLPPTIAVMNQVSLIPNQSSTHCLHIVPNQRVDQIKP